MAPVVLDVERAQVALELLDGGRAAEDDAASLGTEVSMSFSTYPRCARTALRVSPARAPHKEISFAEAVSAQAAPGERTQ